MASRSMEGLLSGLTRVWMADMRGRVLLIGWATTFVGVTTRAFLQKRKNKKVHGTGIALSDARSY